MTERLALSQRQRAIDADDKAARREAILDATERLYNHELNLPSVAAVAAEAGLAKGTMYLYFESKEATYLALHERHSQRFFEALITRLDSPAEFGIADMAAIVDEHMIRQAGFLPLSNVCLGAQPESVQAQTHEAFHLRMFGWLERAGQGLEHRLQLLQPGDGVRFLHHGYALLLGLYQLLGQRSQCAVHARLQAAATGTACTPQMSFDEFRSEALAALRGLWLQAEQHGLAPAAKQLP
jgi:AcrR family transcriptional regulator